jgi:hypothetical protein
VWLRLSPFRQPIRPKLDSTSMVSLAVSQLASK